MKSIGYDSYTSWFVTFSCTLVTSLSAAPYRLAGLVYVLIIEYYETDRTTASVPILLFLVIRCLGGPIISVLGEKFGLEQVTIFGSLLAAVGFATCFLVQNVAGVIFLLGIVYGVGLACSTTFTPSIVKKYFKKNFNTANGISNAGPCLGAFFIPPVATFLIDKYGVSGAFLIISGMMLNAIPVGIYVLYAGVVQDSLIKRQTSEEEKLLSKNQGISEIEDNISNGTLAAAEIHSEEGFQGLDRQYSNKECQSAAVECRKAPLTSPNKEQDAKSINIKSGIISKSDEHCELVPLASSQFREKVFNDPTTENSKANKNGGVQSNLKIQKNSKDKQQKRVYGFKVFKDISFLLVLLTIGFGSYVSSVFWTTMIDYSRDKGVSRSLEIYFLMIQPFADLIGRTCFGWVTDLGYLTLPRFSIVCYCQMAISMFVVMRSNQFWVMIIGSCGYSLASGSMLSVYPSMIFKCVEEDCQTMAISSRYAVYGALVFTSSPLIGYFRENLGSYDGLYCLLMALCLLCAVITPFMFKLSKRKKAALPSEA